MALLAGTMVAVLPASPAAAVTRTLAYVTGRMNGQAKGTVKVIDTADGTVVDTIGQVAAGPQGIAIAPDGKTVYVPGYSSSEMSKIDTATNTIVKTITVGPSPNRPAFSRDGEKLYVPTGATVVVLDTATDEITNRIPVGGNPQGVWVAPNGLAYVPSAGNNTVSVIDTGTETVVKTLPVTYPFAVAIKPDGSRAYVTSISGNQVAVIDAATLTLDSPIAESPGPQAIDISPDGARLYIGHGSGNVTVHTISTGARVTIPSPGFLDAEVSADGSRVYLTGLGGTRVLATADNSIAAVNTGLDTTYAVALGTVTTPSTDLLTTITGSAAQVAATVPVTYNARVKNNGPDASTGAKVTVALSGATHTIKSATVPGGSCAVAAPEVTCTLGALAKDAEVTAEVTVEPQTAGTITAKSTVVAGEPDPLPLNNTDTATTTITAPPAADLGVTVAGSEDTAQVGNTTTFQIDVRNNGPDTAAGVKAAIVLSGVDRTIEYAIVNAGSCTIDGSNIACDLGSLGRDGTNTIAVNYRGKAVGSVTAKATVSADQADPVQDNNSGTDSTTIEPQPTNLGVSFAGSPGPAEAGTAYTYRAEVRNSDSDAATGVRTKVELSGADHTIQSATAAGGSCTVEVPVIDCTIGEIAGNATATVIVTVKPLAAGTITAKATVSSDRPDSTPGNDSDTQSTRIDPRPSADLGVTVTDSADPVEAGTSYTYRALVDNDGPNTATEAKAKVVLSGANHIIQSATVTGGFCTITAPAVNCTIGNLGGDATATVLVTVRPQAAGTITAEATVSADQDDPAAGNNSGTQSTTIDPLPTAGLGVTVTDSADPIALAGTFVATSKVTNAGPDQAGAVTAKVTLTGAASAILGATSTQGTCTIAGAVATCAVGNLARNATATITLTVEPQATGTITATATAETTTADPLPADNTAAQTTAVNNANGCTIIGTAGNNILAGGPGNDVICLLGGNDTVNAFGGNDTVYGGSGADTVQGENGNDNLYGGPGNDTLVGGPGSDKIDGGPGTDICTTGENVSNCP
ncbi:CARDB domain-containing protein [Actinoplanes sp. NPDC000266]